MPQFSNLTSNWDNDPKPSNAETFCKGKGVEWSFGASMRRHRNTWLQVENEADFKFVQICRMIMRFVSVFCGMILHGFGRRFSIWRSKFEICTIFSLKLIVSASCYVCTSNQNPRFVNSFVFWWFLGLSKFGGRIRNLSQFSHWNLVCFSVLSWQENSKSIVFVEWICILMVWVGSPIWSQIRNMCEELAQLSLFTDRRLSKETWSNLSTCGRDSARTL